MFFVFAVTILLFLGYQVNWIYEDSPVKIAFDIVIFIFMAIFVIRKSNIKFVRPGMLFIFLLAVLILSSVPKAISAAVIFGYGYCVVIKANSSLNQALKVFFIINGVVILLQNIGVDAIFYKFQFYSPQWEQFLPLLNNEEGYLQPHQSRAPGIFPSTIYLALFQFLIFGQFIAIKNKDHHAMNFIIGFVFALISSTVSVLLFIFSFIYLLRKDRSFLFQIGFIIGALFLSIFLTPIFDENYTVADKLSRIDVRFVDAGGHSALTDNVVTFSILLCIVGVFIAAVWLYAKKFGRFSAIAAITFLIVTISPLLVHQILEDVRYWLVLGTAFAQLYISTCNAESAQVVGIEGIKRKAISSNPNA